MRIQVDDATIDVSSDGSGDPIVLIHGFPLTREVWDSQAAQLAAHARVIRPDMRGCGRSSAPEGPYLMETLAGDVAAILDAIGVERAAIVGHSMGGYVAMAFCRMYAERVTRLGLVCSRLAADTPQAAKDREISLSASSKKIASTRSWTPTCRENLRRQRLKSARRSSHTRAPSQKKRA